MHAYNIICCVSVRFIIFSKYLFHIPFCIQFSYCRIGIAYYYILFIFFFVKNEKRVSSDNFRIIINCKLYLFGLFVTTTININILGKLINGVGTHAAQK